MTKFGLYFCAILIIFFSGCSQSGSTAFLAPSTLSGSSAKFEGDVSDPGSIAFLKIMLVIVCYFLSINQT